VDKDHDRFAGAAFMDCYVKVHYIYMCRGEAVPRPQRT
jgi:hypothetical protein